jgi:head-tail adaptor
MVRAGPMRHVARIERQTAEQDAAGQPVRTWITHAERRAAVERAVGTEVWASAQRQGRVPVVVRMRYVAGLLPGMRLVLVDFASGQAATEKVHNILSVVDQEGRHEELLITAEELVEASP